MWTQGDSNPDLLAAGQNRVNSVPTCVLVGRERAETAKLRTEKMTPRRGRFSLEGYDVVLAGGTLEDVRIEIVFEIDVGLPR